MLSLVAKAGAWVRRVFFWSWEEAETRAERQIPWKACSKSHQRGNELQCRRNRSG